MTEPGRPNLYQRLNDIAAEVDVIPEKVKMPSNMGGGMGLGIDEVEQIVGPLLTKHGVVTIMGIHNIQPHAENRTLWDVDGVVTLVNVDDPTDRLDVPVRDIGPSPTGAGSFAIKALYRRLFHFVGGNDDEVRGKGSETRRDHQELRPHTNSGAQRAETSPTNGQGVRAATEPQKETLEKLARSLGETSPVRDGLTSAEAGQLISELSKRYNESRTSATR